MEQPRGKHLRILQNKRPHHQHHSQKELCRAERTDIGQCSEIRSPAYKVNGNRTKQTTFIKKLFGKENANQTISAIFIKNKNKAEEYNTTVTFETNTVKQVFGKLYPFIHLYV